MAELKLFMVLLGCRPKGRNTEQHDVFFGVGATIKELVPQFKAFWPGAGTMHVDAWREVTIVANYSIAVVPVKEAGQQQEQQLFFLNLGGYKKNEFDEFHYKMLVVAPDQKEAVRQAKQTAFYKHTGIPGAPAHIDDKFGVDVDELYQVKEILAPELTAKYSIRISSASNLTPDKLHLGYFPFHKL